MTVWVYTDDYRGSPRAVFATPALAEEEARRLGGGDVWEFDVVDSESGLSDEVCPIHTCEEPPCGELHTTERPRIVAGYVGGEREEA